MRQDAEQNRASVRCTGNQPAQRSQRLKRCRSRTLSAAESQRYASSVSGTGVSSSSTTEVAARKITKAEKEDVLRVLRSREKMLKTMVVTRAAELKTSFEVQISRQYSPHENPIWDQAVAAARAAVADAEAQIAAECQRLGIPQEFQPGVDMLWSGRGQNALARRRAELRALANAQIDEAKKRALEKIELTLSGAREKVLISGLGDEALAMINELPTLGDMMPALTIDATEHDLLTMSKRSREHLLGSDSYRYN